MDLNRFNGSTAIYFHLLWRNRGRTAEKSDYTSIFSGPEIINAISIFFLQKHTLTAQRWPSLFWLRMSAQRIQSTVKTITNQIKERKKERNK